MPEPFVVAIDGPAGAGKSTVARAVADRLGFLFLDTGAMYRALTWKVMQQEVAWDDEAAIGQLARQTRIRLAPDQVLVDGFDVTRQIRHPDVSRHVSLVARVPEVREVLVAEQRAIAEGQRGVVAEGRDMGTTVFPRAQLKVYLVASPQERARRRFHDLQHHGIQPDLAALTEEIQRRDEIDSTRAVSPLCPAEDAIRLDSDPLTQEQVVERILELCQPHLFDAGRGRSGSR